MYEMTNDNDDDNDCENDCDNVWQLMLIYNVRIVIFKTIIKSFVGTTCNMACMLWALHTVRVKC